MPRQRTDKGMERWCTKSDLKALLIGGGMALAAGMTMGFSMQPQLGIGEERPQGPQQFTVGSAARSTGPFDPGTGYSYSGQMPDYVIGTDWKKAASYASDPAPPRPDREEMKLARYEEPAAVSHETLPEAKPAPVSYPSLSGGERYGTEPAAPTAQDEETPPTIVG